MKKVVTRFAPSPTGFPHVGSFRTALYNYLFAKKHGGTFYLRIEDTDRSRFVADSEDYIKNSLEWLGISPDIAPWTLKPGEPSYRQSERIYSHHIKKLLDVGAAYYAFDTPEYIENAKKRYATPDGKNTTFIYNSRFRGEMRNSLTMNVNEIREMLKGPHVVRFKTPENLQFSINDLVRGNVKFDTNLMDDKILVKSDGGPTYHLSNVCDDHDMGTTHVIRGEEWLPSTGLHYLLYQSMGWDIPEFAHLPLVLNPNGDGKLSKRSATKLGIPIFPFNCQYKNEKDEIINCPGFKELGYLPQALLNFVALLGWSPKDKQEIMPLSKMIQKFDLNNVHLNGSRYEIHKLDWFNSEYLSKIISNEGLLGKAQIDPYYTPEKQENIINLAKVRAVTTTDLQKVVDIFTRDVPLPIEEGNNPITHTTEMSILHKVIIKGRNVHHTDWNETIIKEIVETSCKESSEGLKTILPELRKLVCKGIKGPGVFETMEILGRNESLYRISNGLLK